MSITLEQLKMQKSCYDSFLDFDRSCPWKGQRCPSLGRGKLGKSTTDSPPRPEPPGTRSNLRLPFSLGVRSFPESTRCCGGPGCAQWGTSDRSLRAGTEGCTGWRKVVLCQILLGLFPSSGGGRLTPGATCSGSVDGDVGAFCTARHSRNRTLVVPSCELVREAAGLGIPREAVPAVHKGGLSSCEKLLRTMLYKDYGDFYMHICNLHFIFFFGKAIN